MGESGGVGGLVGEAGEPSEVEPRVAGADAVALAPVTRPAGVRRGGYAKSQGKDYPERD